MRNIQLAGPNARSTGSDSRIGQATAIAKARAGADIAVTWFKDQAGGEQTRQAIVQLGRRVVRLQLDVRDPPSVARAFDEKQAHLGICILLARNAGCMPAIIR